MACCHADFALVEGSDRGFTLGMPTFTFGAGVLAEAGDNARELGLKRVALFTDRSLRDGRARRQGARRRSQAAGVDVVVYDEVVDRADRRVVPGRGALRARTDASTATSRSAAAR